MQSRVLHTYVLVVLSSNTVCHSFLCSECFLCFTVLCMRKKPQVLRPQPDHMGRPLFAVHHLRDTYVVGTVRRAPVIRATDRTSVQSQVKLSFTRNTNKSLKLRVLSFLSWVQPNVYYWLRIPNCTDNWLFLYIPSCGSISGIWIKLNCPKHQANLTHSKKC